MVSLPDSLNQPLVGTLTAVDLGMVVCQRGCGEAPAACFWAKGNVVSFWTHRASSHSTEVYLSGKKHLYTKNNKANTAS